MDSRTMISNPVPTIAPLSWWDRSCS